MKLLFSWLTFLIALGCAIYLHFKVIGIGLIYYSLIGLMIICSIVSMWLLDIDYLLNIRTKLDRWFFDNNKGIDNEVIDPTMIPPV